ATTDSDSTTPEPATPQSRTASRRREGRERRAPFAGRTRRLPYHSWSLCCQWEPRRCLARPYRSEPVNPMNGAGVEGHFRGSAGRPGSESHQGQGRRSGKPARAAASSVLKFDIAVLFNRHLLERFHRALQQRDVVGIPRLAVEAAARGLGAGDAFLLLADLATRQMFKGRGRNVAWGNIIGLACARTWEGRGGGGQRCGTSRGFWKGRWG